MSRASKNLEKYRYYSVDGLNVYDLLRFDAAIISKSSLEKISARCGSAEKAEK
jgi:large subunit ribosomal protein L4